MIVGIIPDGNRRWAKERGMSSEAGHVFGIRHLERIMEYALTVPEIEHLYVYLLAWHNWERGVEELLNLFKLYPPLVHKYCNHPKVTLQLGHPPREIGPNIDIVIRTGGHRRLSGFFPEESKGAELVVSEKYWPDFTIEDFHEAIEG